LNNLWAEAVLRLLLSVALGAAVGYQRERVGKVAGLRTHMLIALGASLFTVISVLGFAGADVSRVAAGVVAGVGFIGAGVIFHSDKGVAGLTTAASIWIMAAVGMAAGAGLYLVAVVAAFVAMGILMINKGHDREEKK
jgi:putative Mg2+ transporter-C (MgtC) family protein